MAASGYFITGTDTDIGKTWVTVALLHYFRQSSLSAVGMKPVSAGCVWRDGRLENSDAFLFQTHASHPFSYELINPYAFELAVSPHIAAGEVLVEPQVILTAYTQLGLQVDRVLVEGAGGWLSPLSQTLDNAGLAAMLGLPVIMVVGMRLGCINQARLTWQAIRQTGVTCAGWVAVQLAPERCDYKANLAYLCTCLDIPLLGEMPYQAEADFDFLAKQLHLEHFDGLLYGYQDINKR